MSVPCPNLGLSGYGWGTGDPSLSKLCVDAEESFDASNVLLREVGCDTAKRICWGRSIGATCAVHLAARRARHIFGLVIDSGLMSIKQLPLLGVLGQQMMGPQAAGLLAVLPEPCGTLAKLRSITCPLLVMHGVSDEIVPFNQGVQCHDQCGSESKSLVQFVAGHNDVTALHYPKWSESILALMREAASFPNTFPAGTIVETVGLKAQDFCGIRGEVTGAKGDRVLVLLPEKGEKALKPENLNVVDT